MASFYIENFGCRATQADGAAIERQFRERGLERAGAPTQAEIVVLNTCTVTAAADQDARAAIRRVHRENPSCQIVVTGCYAQRAPEEIAALPGVSRVIGNSHKHALAEIALGKVGQRSTGEDARSYIETPIMGQRSTGGNARSYIDAPIMGQRSTGGDARSYIDTPIMGQRSTGGDARSYIESLGNAQFVPLSHLTTGDRIFVSDIFAHTELLAAPVFEAVNQRTRPNLKVQDGCDNRCSFCVIPYVRGQSRSLPLNQVLREVNVLVDAGYREVAISGINLGRWGRDLGSAGARPSGAEESVSQLFFRSSGARSFSTFHPRLAPWAAFLRRFAANLRDAIPLSRGAFGGDTDSKVVPSPRSAQRLRFEDVIREILGQTSLEKLRISSVEPMDWSDELIRLMAESPRIAKHAHVPMQSGSDRVLRLMHRKYRPWHYREKIEKIRAAMPTAAIGADVMAGFPGETAADFDETRRMVEDLPFTYLHVFTYSPRPGTPAAAMRNQVPVQIARERNRILRELAAEKKLAFMRGFIGQTVEAITLHSPGALSSRAEPIDLRANQSGGVEGPAVFTEALTDNYLKLRLKGRHAPNRWLTPQVEQVEDGALVGAAH